MTDRLPATIEVIESGYEFLLAYAAQGRDSDGGPPSEVRDVLSGMQNAIAEIRTMMQAWEQDFADVVADDARKSAAAIALVLAQQQIASEMVDNLNVSIHLRALLTDLFLVGDAATNRGTA